MHYSCSNSEDCIIDDYMLTLSRPLWLILCILVCDYSREIGSCLKVWVNHHVFAIINYIHGSTYWAQHFSLAVYWNIVIDKSNMKKKKKKIPLFVITLTRNRILIKKENRQGHDILTRSVANIPFSIGFFPGYTARLIHEPNLLHVSWSRPCDGNVGVGVDTNKISNRIVVALLNFNFYFIHYPMSSLNLE